MTRQRLAMADFRANRTKIAFHADPMAVHRNNIAHHARASRLTVLRADAITCVASGRSRRTVRHHAATCVSVVGVGSWSARQYAVCAALHCDPRLRPHQGPPLKAAQYWLEALGRFERAVWAACEREPIAIGQEPLRFRRKLFHGDVLAEPFVRQPQAFETELFAGHVIPLSSAIVLRESKRGSIRVTDEQLEAVFAINSACTAGIAALAQLLVEQGVITPALKDGVASVMMVSASERSPGQVGEGAAKWIQQTFRAIEQEASAVLHRPSPDV